MSARAHHTFTLTEVMIATVILALAAVALLTMISSAQANVLRAEKRWDAQHHRANVTEYYLLAGPNATEPSDLLPTSHHASCELLEIDDLHEESQEAVNGWNLYEYVIRVMDETGAVQSETHVRKVLKEEDAE